MDRRAPGRSVHRRAALALCALGGLALAGGEAGAQDPGAELAEGAVRAAILSFEGEIDELSERTLEMRLERALARGPRFVILSIDSPGGDAEVSHRLAWKLRNMPEPPTTVAFVRDRALSGATFVAFGCDLVAMAPGGQLGDAMPIWLSRSGSLQPEVAEKFVAPVRKDLRDLAELQGYPGAAAEAMVDPRLELHRLELRDPEGRIRPVWLSREELGALPPPVRARIVSQRVVCPEGQLLVIGPEEAREMGIARLFARDEAELCRALAEEHSLAAVVPTPVPGLWWEDVVRLLVWWPVKSLLFVIGLLSLFVAVSTPGQGWPEAAALGAFGLVFFGSWLIGLADSMELVLFVLGVALLLAELLTPHFGLLGLSGLVLLMASLLLSYQTFLVPQSEAQWAELRGNVGKTLLAFGGATLGLMLLVRFVPRFGRLGGLIHQGSLPATVAPTQAEVRGEQVAAIGATGSAATTLRPAGKVRVGDEVYGAVAESGWIDAGTVVVVMGRRGNELVVAARPEAQPPTGETRGGEPGPEGEASA